MRTIVHLLAAAGLALSAVGCSFVSDTVDMLDVDDTPIEEPRPDADLPPKVAVERIENLELGRLSDGFVLTAFATAPGLGYYQPELAPRYEGAPGPDGFLEFDFIVRPPFEVQPGGEAAARLVRADLELIPGAIRTARGVRVYSGQGSLEGRF